MDSTSLTALPDVLDELLRWEAAGGEWRVSSVGPPARVSLLTCDGGEEMARVESSAPSFVAYIEARLHEIGCERVAGPQPTGATHCSEPSTRPSSSTQVS